MHRLLIGACNDSLLLPCAVHASTAPFSNIQLYESGSLGTAVVMEHEIVLSNGPAASCSKITNLLTDLHTNQFVSVQQDTLFGSYRTNQSLPTRYRGWVFTISGAPPQELADPDGQIAKDLPGFLHSVANRGVDGSVLFAWALSTFYQAGILESAPAQRDRPLQVLCEGMRTLTEKTGLCAIPCSFTLTNRTYSVGFVGEGGMYQFSLNGIENCQRCQNIFSRQRSAPHQHLRLSLLASVPEQLPSPWTKVSGNQCFQLDQSGAVTTEHLD